MDRQPPGSPPNADCHFRPAGSGWVLRVRHFGAMAVCLLISLLVFPAMGAADPLAGTVVGADGQPKPYVRIDIIGPRKVVVVADENGRFAVDVPQGRYKVRVTDDRRRMDFATSSPAQGKQFKLGW